VPEAVACNLCGADNPRYLYSLRDYRFRVDYVDWRIVQCRSCGLGYLNPRPDPNELAKYYPSAYFEARGDPAAARRYLRQAEFVPRGPGDLLDIGTAGGDFLAVMSEAGWRVVGVEPSPDAGNRHELAIVRADFPSERVFAADSFDVVTAWAVFEHLSDPAAAFRECARLLRPGGSLVIQVPNLRSVFGRLSRQEDVPRHLYFFSPRTLRRYGEHAGLALDSIVHSTDLFGGAGRGVLRLAVARACGKSTGEFFELLWTSRRERFRRAPLLAVPWLAAAALEHVVLSDAATRALRVSGQIVATFRAPAA
jgi:SAM-dependent methyltransferase